MLQPELGSLCDAALCPGQLPHRRGTPGQGSPEGCACLRGPDGPLLPWAAGSLLSPREDALPPAVYPRFSPFWAIPVTV